MNPSDPSQGQNRANADTLDLPDGLSASDVRAQLQLILDSPAFAGSERLQGFLRFIVEETLAGRARQIKGFSIGEALFSDNGEFDPQSNAIVRVEAGRLRRRLAEYYVADDLPHRVRISVPKGTYVPEFKRLTPTTTVEPEERTGTASRADRTGNWRILRFTAVLALILVATWLGMTALAPDPDENESPSVRPFVAVAPLTSVSGDPLEARLSTGLAESLSTALAKLSGLSVMTHRSMTALNENPVDLSAIASEFGITHVLQGSLERERDTLRVNARLVETRSGVTVWAERLDGAVDGMLEIQDTLVNQLVARLDVIVSPGEQARLEQHHTSSPEAETLFRQGLVLMMSPNEPGRVQAAGQMFARVTEIDPAFAGGYAGLSFVDSVTVLFLQSSNIPGDLQSGIRHAIRAIETDENFGMGYATLAFAYALDGRHEEARFNADRSVEIQPGDAFTQFLHGISLALAQRPGDAIPSLTKALDLDPAEPRTPYRNVLGLAYFGAGQHAEARRSLEENIDVGGPVGPHTQLFHLLALDSLGMTSEAARLAETLSGTVSTFPFSRWLSWWVHDPEELSRLSQRLKTLGLLSPETGGQ